MGGEELLCTEGTGVATPGTDRVVGSLGLLDRVELRTSRGVMFVTHCLMYHVEHFSSVTWPFLHALVC